MEARSSSSVNPSRAGLQHIAAAVFTAPTGPLPGNANSFTVGLAVYRPVRPQTPPPAQPNTNPTNLRPPSSPAAPHTPYQKPKGDDGSGTDPPNPEPSVPSDSESYPSSSYRVTEKENEPSNKKEEIASTKKDNDTPASDEEDASTSVLAQMPATFGAAIAVIAWMYA
ncbi:hypothetical protein MRS44_011697 [Fusarium solani]|uniref:uncharacterized protein n=1 Tax=Fusarium solani TaxID=169388 RepID=UPI0032C483C4|nr:hypothetical protein MRS44_011697 [Fusarium solani]